MIYQIHTWIKLLLKECTTSFNNVRNLEHCCNGQKGTNICLADVDFRCISKFNDHLQYARPHSLQRYLHHVALAHARPTKHGIEVWAHSSHYHFVNWIGICFGTQADVAQLTGKSKGVHRVQGLFRMFHVREVHCTMHWLLWGSGGSGNGGGGSGGGGGVGKATGHQVAHA